MRSVIFLLAAVAGQDPPFANSLTPPENILEWDDYCKYKNGPESYCKHELEPMLCQGGDQACGDGPVPSVGVEATTLTLESVQTTVSPTSISPLSTTSAVATTTVTTVPGANDIRYACDAYCESVNGANSYCKWWFKEPVCKGGNQPCGTLDLCTSDSPFSPTTRPSDETVPAPSVDGLHHPECDYMCKSMNNILSYCKWWMDTPVCHGGDQPCGDVGECRSQDWPEPQTPTPAPGAHPGPSRECDAYCAGLNGDGSYCKWWKAVAVCKGGDQPCGVGECATTSEYISIDTPTTVSPVDGDRHSGPNVRCDAYCVDQNPGLSGYMPTYCKWWLTVPVCKHGNQPCNPSICDNAPLGSYR
ncbi:hypothetical protein FOZ63_024750 [Perkinsus olseni]|uniref:Uncharacterized protein n=2 Tax=Perkinsus olseni TaxID=32597 RepID=A0A7J6U0U7_PEROL|nr:hypothetical protein FOZ63_024750 [Perkinsus olseni]